MFSMKIIITSVLSLAIAVTAWGQTSEPDKKIALKTAADRMNHGLVNKDYDAVISTTYPKAIEMARGGRERMLEVLQTQMNALEKQGNKIVAAWIEDPTPFIDTAGELQCTVPQKMKLQMEEGKLTTQTTLVAISPDKGATWYFVDASDRDIHAMRTVFPNLSSELDIPKSPLPTFEPDKKPAAKPATH